MNFKKVCVVGLGYIGLPTAAIAADSGYKTIGVDINKDIVNVINKGKTHIVEPELNEIVFSSVSSGNLKALSLPEASDVFVITVPTPLNDNDKSPDLTFIKSAADLISPVISRGNLIILESTSPVGTTKLLANWLHQTRSELNFAGITNKKIDIFISYCPERVLPGKILKELKENDRIIGGLCEDSANLAEIFYKKFVTGNIHKTDTETAELSKLIENSYRDVNIAFANELDSISEDLGISSRDVINLANKHPRVNILNPGPGVGGHCIAVDPWFIISQNDQKSTLMKQARLINDKKPSIVVNKILDFCSKNETSYQHELKIGLFGLSYKPNIDDLRESPSLKIANLLSEKLPGKIYAVEPHIDSNNEKLKGNFKLVSYKVAQESCDLLVYLVSHSEFVEELKKNMPKKVIFDYCGIIK